MLKRPFNEAVAREEADAYSVQYGEHLSDARTKLGARRVSARPC